MRQKLIDVVALMKKLGIAYSCSYCQYNDGCFCKASSNFVNACEAICEAPIVEVPQWIPVSERLPEKTGNYLVSGSEKVWVCECVEFGGIKGWVNNARNPIIKAWMPLPEPYEGG